jgi:phosphate transport system substrate-binding protein
MASIVQAWEESFRRHHPEVQFENRLMGTDTAMAGLYGGVADLALLGRESNTTENDGFLHSLQYKPLQLHLMTGSLDAANDSFAPLFFVQKANPLEQLTLAQADALLGCRQPGQEFPVRTWSDLGLGGDWAKRPVHLYMINVESGTGVFVLRRLQGESKKVNWPIVREFSDARHRDGTAYDAAEQTMDALRNDPYGIAVSGLRYADDAVKALPLSSSADVAPVRATRQTLVDRTYPLARMTYAFVNRPPDRPIPPLLLEFLRFIYSDEGQNLIPIQSGFLPLSAKDAEQQRLALN